MVDPGLRALTSANFLEYDHALEENWKAGRSLSFRELRPAPLPEVQAFACAVVYSVEAVEVTDGSISIFLQDAPVQVNGLTFLPVAVSPGQVVLSTHEAANSDILWTENLKLSTSESENQFENI